MFCVGHYSSRDSTHILVTNVTKHAAAAWYSIQLVNPIAPFFLRQIEAHRVHGGLNLFADTYEEARCC